MGTSQAKLIIASSEESADFYWATRFFIPDPTPFIHKGNHKYLIVSDLEYNRALKEAKVNQVISFASYEDRLKKNRPLETRMLDILELFLRDHKIRSLTVPPNFPLKTALALKKRGFTLKPSSEPLYEKRLIKTIQEKKEIQKSLHAVSQAFKKAFEVLKRSRIRNHSLEYRGQRLTSQILRGIIDQHLLKKGYVAQHTIVACGRQSADPHSTGSGPLRPHQPIIIDIFPRSQKSGYCGDMTRTVVKGRASPELKKMYRAVRKAQKAAIAMIRPRVQTSRIHQKVCDTLKDCGFETKPKKGIPQGFIHSTGHGLGLEVHEPPRISTTKERLKKGHVIAIEPGLYYPKIGGVRLEDVVYVTSEDCERLSRLPQRLEIP